MPSKIQKIISSVILGLMALVYIFLEMITQIAGQPISGAVFIISAMIAVGAIVGINNRNKVLLWLGIILALIQIVSGIISLANRCLASGYVSGGNIILFVLLLCILWPVVVMYKIVKERVGSQGK